MRHLRIIGLALVAVFAVTAFAASSASALPEWGKCEAKAGGKYLDSNCTKKGTLKNPGSFEWKKGASLAPVSFSGHNEGSGGVLTTGLNECHGGTDEGKRVPRKTCTEAGGTVSESGEGHISVECAAETNTGVSEGAKKISKVHVTFTGCNLGGSIPCNSEGAPEGEIHTNELKGELGYISKAAHEVAVKLEPAKKGGAFALFKCPGIVVATNVGVGNTKEGTAYTEGGEAKGGYDQILSPITPVNAMTSTYTQVYTVNYTTLENIPSNLEKQHRSDLEDYLVNESIGFSSLWSRAGEEITNVNTPTEPGEIKG